MRTKSIFIIASIALASMLTLSSCSTKTHAINQLEDLTYDLRDNCSNYSISEWQEAANRYIDIRKKINKHYKASSADQKERIGKLQGEAANYVAKGAKSSLISNIGGIASELKGLLEGIMGLVGGSSDK